MTKRRTRKRYRNSCSNSTRAYVSKSEKSFACDREDCDFISNTQCGVSIHHGLVHRKTYSGEDVSSPDMIRLQMDTEGLVAEEISQFGQDSNDFLGSSDVDSEFFDFSYSIDSGNDAASLSLNITQDFLSKKKELFNYIRSRMTPDELDFCLLCTTNGFSIAQAGEILKWKSACDDHNEFGSNRGLRTLYKILDGAATSFFKENSFRTMNIKVPRPGIRTSLIFAYESPSSLLIEMLMDPELTCSNSFDLEYKESYTKEGYKRIGGFNTGNWWQFAEHKARGLYGSDVFILPFILFSDKTVVTGDSKRSVWPIYITLGNFNIRTRNRISAKQLVGFIPNVENRHVKNMKDTTAFTNSIFSFCYKTILDDLKSFASESDIHPVFRLNLPFEECERKFVFVPMMIPSDHEERVKHACLRGGQTNRPCPTCLVTRSMLKDNVYNPNVGERKIREMTEILIRNNESEKKLYSLKNKLPARWEWFDEYNNLGYYHCLPACFIHVVQAVTKYLIHNTVDAIKHFRIKERPIKNSNASDEMGNNTDDEEQGFNDVENVNLASDDIDSIEKPKLNQAQRLSEMENRLADFPRFSFKGKSFKVFFLNRLGSKFPRFYFKGKSFKVFRIDLEKGGTKLTCTERVELLYQMKYVLSTDVGTLLPKSLHWKIFNVISLWEDVLDLTWRKPGDDSYTQDDIELLFKCIVKFKKRFSSTFTAQYQRIDRKILFHALDHFAVFIFLYGHPKNWSTGSFEHWHTRTKKVYLRTQRQYWDCGAQMIKYMRRLRLIRHYKSEEETTHYEVGNNHDQISRVVLLKFGKEEKSMHDDVPLNRIYSLLKSCLETFEIMPLDFASSRNFKRVYLSSITLGDIGKIYATGSYGKYKTPLYSNVFIDLTRTDDVRKASIYTPEYDDCGNTSITIYTLYTYQ